MTIDPFRITSIPGAVRRPIERALGVTALRELYGRARGPHDLGEPFERRALRVLAIDADVAPSDLDAIPRCGPVVIASNHPHGAVDGLLLLDIVRRVRPDVRVLANRLLGRIPELHESCFFVDPFDGPAAAARSRAGLRAAHLWLRRGGALVVFPSGEVAHRRVDGGPADGAWKTTFERLARASGAPVIRSFIEGRNSRLFYAAGLIHPMLRTALLGRELLNKRGRSIRVRFDAPDDIGREIANLDAEACLVESGRFQVFCAEAAAIPATLREIGRLREIAFRAVGEGTGRSIDIDAFDRSYLHLFVWDRERQQVVGAYRIGRCDRIVRDAGVSGLYTRTLFEYDERLLDRLGAPALELGRSFVRVEYQREHSPLLLLWRGIGTFVARHPEYRFLFGPVSISARYTDASHAMLIEFLRHNHLASDLAELVQAVAPARVSPPQGALVPASAGDVNRLLARSETDGKGMPVLLRQYLKLNARLIGVNVDANFGDAVDALMIVDLTGVRSSILQRYLGSRGAAAFLSFHARPSSMRAA